MEKKLKTKYGKQKEVKEIHFQSMRNEDKDQLLYFIKNYGEKICLYQYMPLRQTLKLQ